jgi:hypothetical protein
MRLGPNDLPVEHGNRRFDDTFSHFVIPMCRRAASLTIRRPEGALTNPRLVGLTDENRAGLAQRIA